MADKKGRSGHRPAAAATAAGLLAGLWPRHAFSAPEFSPTTYLGVLDPQAIWELVVGGFIAASFVVSLLLWAASRLRKLQRARRRRNALLNTVLNRLSQGLVIADAKGRITFCNDRYLEIYGLSRHDIAHGMTTMQLIELRRTRGTLDLAADDYLRIGGEAGGHVAQLASGRSVLVKHMQMQGGGLVSTHDDCTEQRQLARELSTTKRFLESVIDNIPVCVAAKNIEDGRYILANRAFEKFSRLSRAKIVGSRPEEIYPAASAARVHEADRNAIANPDQPQKAEIAIEFGSNTRIISSNRVVACNDRNEPEFLIALFEDVTERRALSRELETTRKFLERVVDNIPIPLTVQRVADRRYLLANRSAEPILNRRREDAIGLSLAELFSEKEARLISDRDDGAIRRGGCVMEEQPISTSAGLRLCLTRRAIVLDETGAPEYLIKTHEDVTERRQTEARMAHMAYHDGLTDLPNRFAFLQALEQMIGASDAAQDQFAVLSLDLDGLKEVNDVFGHEVGDRVLIEVANRLQAVAHRGLVARLSGDEFGLIVDGPQPSSALDLAAAVTFRLSRYFEVDGKPLRIGATTGVAVFPDNGTDAATLLANADAALFRAKSRMRGSVNVFDPEMDRQIRDRRALHQDLSAALENGELSLHYQPQAACADPADTITGFEALARWQHPQRGFVPPSEFIPLAEESGMIVALGEWILREACREAASWPNPLQISVNLSPAQFLHGNLVGVVHATLLETGLSPSRLELEITEGVLIEDFERGLSLLRRLTALGVRISMDDFGSGYSSLTYLQAFPFNKIKIDRGFVMNLGRNPQSAAIVRAVIGLGEGLGVAIVAEGVETRAQLEFLVRENAARCRVI